ncbi:MAG: hypothetical protein ACFFC6_12615 [Promethearchaeota archaeon]
MVFSKDFSATTLKPFFFAFGSYVFCYCLGVTLHEFGHAITLTLFNVPDVRIVVHPFALSETRSGVIPTHLLPWSSVMGPLFNVFCGVLVSLIFWKKRSAYTLPFVMLGPVALLQEGVAVFIGLIDLPNLSDWGTVIIIGGVSPLLVALLGVVFLVTGILFFLLIFPLLHLSSEKSFVENLAIGSAFVMYSLLSVLYAALFDTFVLQWRIIAFFSSVILVTFIIAIYKPIRPYLDRISTTEVKPLNWNQVLVAFGFAFVMVSIDFIFFYLPTL